MNSKKNMLFMHLFMLACANLMQLTGSVENIGFLVPFFGATERDDQPVFVGEINPLKLYNKKKMIVMLINCFFLSVSFTHTTGGDEV